MDRNSVPSYNIDLYIRSDWIKLNFKSTDSYKYFIFIKKLTIYYYLLNIIDLCIKTKKRSPSYDVLNFENGKMYVY